MRFIGRLSLVLLLSFLLVNPIYAKKKKQSNKKANRALLFAIQSMNVSKATKALKMGASANGKDEDGWPLFISAINSEKMSMINLLITYKARVNMHGPDGKTPLMHALSMENKKLSWFLIRKRAKMNVKDNNGKSAMMYAAESGYYDIVKYMVKRKVNVYAKDSRGWNALGYAMARKHRKIIKLLGEYETRPVDFAIAVATGNTIKVRTILRQGIDINAANSEGEPAILVAVKNNDRMMLRLLLENNAELNIKNKKGYTILMYTFAAQKFEMSKILLSHGGLGDFNYQYKDGKTALMLAIIKKNRRIIKSVMKFRQNFNIRDTFGNTALVYAAGLGLSDVVRTLLKKGADPTIPRKDGRTVIDIARAKGYTYITRILEEKM